MSDLKELKCLLESHLIHCGVRKAWLFTGNASHGEYLRKTILNYYPKLRILYINPKDLDITQGGWYISKRKLNINNVNTHTKIAHQLGYKCKVPFERFDWSGRFYEFKISIDTPLGDITVMTPSDQTLDYIGYYKDLVKKMTKALRTFDVYQNLKARLEVKIRYSYRETIEMLTYYKPEHASIIEDSLDREMDYWGINKENINLNDPLHRGILVGLRASTIRSYLDKVYEMIPYEYTREYRKERHELLEIALND